MSCDRNGRRCASAASRNGISGHISRFLNTVTSWDTYRDVDVRDIPERILGVASHFFGLPGPLKGMLGLMVATHLVEQVTGSIVTMAIRLKLRGEPMDRYRGIILRRSPISPRLGRLQNILLRGRVRDSKGFYFHESGRTWHCHTACYRVGDVDKRLTLVQSLSVPNREFWFDRELGPQQAVDLALGDLDPDTIPGYIGAINELDHLLAASKALKKAVYLANWLLVDDTERDAGPDLVDYDLRPEGNDPAGGGGGWSGGRLPGGPASPPYGASAVGRSPATTSYNPRDLNWYRSRYGGQGYGGAPQAEDRPVDPNRYVGDLFGSRKMDGEQTVTANGREVPIRIPTIETAPDGAQLARAYWWSDDHGMWIPIEDRAARESLAREVAEGRLVTEDVWNWRRRQAGKR